MNLAVYGNGLGVLKNDVMNHVDCVAFVNPHSCSMIYQEKYIISVIARVFR